MWKPSKFSQYCQLKVTGHAENSNSANSQYLCDTFQQSPREESEQKTSPARYWVSRVIERTRGRLEAILLQKLTMKTHNSQQTGLDEMKFYRFQCYCLFDLLHARVVSFFYNSLHIYVVHTYQGQSKRLAWDDWVIVELGSCNRIRSMKSDVNNDAMRQLKIDSQSR